MKRLGFGVAALARTSKSGWTSHHRRHVPDMLKPPIRYRIRGSKKGYCNYGYLKNAIQIPIPPYVGSEVQMKKSWYPQNT